MMESATKRSIWLKLMRDSNPIARAKRISSSRRERWLRRYGFVLFLIVSIGTLPLLSSHDPEPAQIAFWLQTALNFGVHLLVIVWTLLLTTHLIGRENRFPKRDLLLLTGIQPRRIAHGFWQVIARRVARGYAFVILIQLGFMIWQMIEVRYFFSKPYNMEYALAADLSSLIFVVLYVILSANATILLGMCMAMATRRASVSLAVALVIRFALAGVVVVVVCMDWGFLPELFNYEAHMSLANRRIFGFSTDPIRVSPYASQMFSALLFTQADGPIMFAAWLIPPNSIHNIRELVTLQMMSLLHFGALNVALYGLARWLGTEERRLFPRLQDFRLPNAHANQPRNPNRGIQHANHRL